MDSVTQAVLGGAVAEKILGRQIGNRAVLYGALMGTIPDLDVFVGKFYVPVTALEIHRGFSHSIGFALLLSPLLGFLLARIERKRNITWLAATSAAFLCLFTHALLDAFTTWGTQLFWPADYRVDFKSIFVIDPLYTLPFLYCLIRAMQLPRESEKRNRWNIRGLIISTAYLMLATLVKLNSVGIFERSLEQNGMAYKRLIVKPSPLNIILWNANIETEDGYWLADYSYFDRSAIRYDFYPKGEQYLGDLKNSDVIRQLIKISEGWYVITKRNGKVFFNDLRFGMLNDDVQNPQFTFSYEIVNDNGNVSALEVDKNRVEASEMLKRLVSRIGGR